MKNLINSFESQCRKWQEDFKGTDLNFVYNQDLNALNPKKIKYILVADNPGKEEVKAQRYLIGSAGISTRSYFENALVKNFKEEVLVLNKTPVYTNITKDLEKYNDLISDSQIYMVNFICELHKILKQPVIIMGYSNGLIKRKDKLVITNGVLAPFFHQFAKCVNNKEIKDYYFIKHFSRNMFYSSQEISIVDYEKNPANILFMQGTYYRKMFEKNIKI